MPRSYAQRNVQDRPVPIFSTTFNRCVQVEARADHLSADTGALLLREIMERTGIVEWMTGRLVDPRDPNTITYPLADLLRTNLLLLGQGWRDQDDADRLRTTRASASPATAAAGPPAWSRIACCPPSRRCHGCWMR